MAKDTEGKSGPKLNLLERTIAKVSRAVAWDRAMARDKLKLFGYDAANPGTARGYSGGQSKNAHPETPKARRDRINLMWDARDLVRNMPVLRCAVRRFAQYVCPTIQYQALAGDSETNRQYEAYFEEWFNKVDRTGRFSGQEMAELVVSEAFTDGDIGAEILMNPHTGGVGIQLIESDRIGNPSTVAAETRNDYVSGVHLDPCGKPTDYDVFTRSPNSTYKFEKKIPARVFIHYADVDRYDQVRGVTRMAPVLAQTRDLYEMFAFERGAAKWAASIAGVITEDADTAPIPGMNTAVGGWDGETTSGTPTQKVEGNKLLRLKRGEDVSVFNTSARPSGAFIAYIDAAIRDIAMGLNLPYGFFDMRQFGGATSRLETMQVQRSVAREQRMLIHKFLGPIMRAIIDQGIATGKIPPSPNKFRCRWGFGRHITADVGYETQSNILRLQNLLSTRTGQAAEAGENFRDIAETLGQEVQIMQEVAKKYGIPIELLAGNLASATETLAAANAAANPPPPAPATIDQGGEKATAQVLDLLKSVGEGKVDRESAINTLVTIYNIPFDQASIIVPFPQPVV